MLSSRDRCQKMTEAAFPIGVGVRWQNGHRPIDVNARGSCLSGLLSTTQPCDHDKECSLGRQHELHRSYSWLSAFRFFAVERTSTLKLPHIWSTRWNIPGTSRNRVLLLCSWTRDTEPLSPVQMYTNSQRIKMHSVIQDVTLSTESPCWTSLSLDLSTKSIHLCILISLNSAVTMSEILHTHVLARVAPTQIRDCRQISFLYPLKLIFQVHSLSAFFSNLCYAHRIAHLLSAFDPSTRCHRKIPRNQVENPTTTGAHCPR
jgi:hypothetical protein